MESTGQFFRLHPRAAFMCEAGYVFLDLDGRLFRMPEGDFNIARARCCNGVEAKRLRPLRPLLIECGSPGEAANSFALQEMTSDEL
jgi:hypothetical protein